MRGFSHCSAAALVTAFLAAASPVSAESPALGPDPVRVTIWERLPEPWAWQVRAGEPDDAYAVPVFGFGRIPTRYNARGIEVDRSNPFALHAEATLAFPAGPYRLILRTRNAARLLVDGHVLAESNPIRPNSSGNEDVPEIVPPEDPRWRYVAPGDQERIVAWTSDGREHRIELWAVVGGKKLRPETGELSVSIVAPGGVPELIGGREPGAAPVLLTDDGWETFTRTERARIDDFDTARRRAVARSEDPYWKARHDLARRLAEQAQAGLADETRPRDQNGNVIDQQIEPAAGPADDAAFFRRLALDTIGEIPDSSEVEEFLADPRPDKRARAIDARLADPRWADAWMGYWQDVLAENPGILKPTLNNTGPFREYLHAALLDNTPFDRFVTELIRMEGSSLGGGPAGFGIASQNDAPMAAKAHIVAKAFLAAEMKCARCHDAPFHPFDQADLFGLASMLAGKPLAVPVTSTVQRQPGGRAPAVGITLNAGEVVPPHWNLTATGPEVLPEGLDLPPGTGPRERLAALITAPSNRRFALVIANRFWKRFMGAGLVEPVDDWDNSPSNRHPQLLAALARELMTHDYDLKHLARTILNSRAYQARVVPGSATPAAPARRRMSAEQLLDSLFAAVGKEFAAEELNLDPDGRRPVTEFLNLGTPRRAWEFTSTSNERDRPALALPVVQSLVDVLETFGWRPSRQDPITVRDEATTPLQPALLANGTVAGRVARISDDSALCTLCLQDQPAEALIRSVYLRLLSRPPSDVETSRLVAYLGDAYETRIVPGVAAAPRAKSGATAPRRVSWSNHLSPEASTIQIEREKSARAGDPPTARLTGEFRERMEDIVWALLNSPEFVFVP
jgi:hypothetical protein